MIPPTRVREFVDEVRALLAVLDEYDRTIDPHLRREIRKRRFELHARSGWLAADLAEEIGDESSLISQLRLVAGEGGAV